MIMLLQDSTFNPRGTTWAHPFDFFPELCPLPEEACGTKPFSVGCVAVAGGAWSEVTQVGRLKPACVHNRGVYICSSHALWHAFSSRLQVACGIF